MDLYHKNPNTLRRLLNKRQNPCAQIFKAQPLNSTDVPMSEMNLLLNNVSDQQLPNLLLQNSTLPTHSPNNLSHSQTHNPLSTQSPSLNSPHQPEGDEDDEALREKIQKKVKTSTLSSGNTDSQRKFSCEEEKEESEHSTACETRSEFNTSNENGEFLFSPSMTHTNSREVPEMKLDGNDDTPIRSGVVHLDMNLLGGDLSRKGFDDLTHRMNENFNIHREKCNLNHQCEMELGPNLKRICPRCAVLLDECREFAKKNDGFCLNEEYEESIKYKCNKGHCWTLNYKNARRRWCAQCAKEQRAFMKKKCEAENIEREKQEEEYQRKLFEEARRKASTESSTKQPFNLSGNTGSEGQKSMNTLEYFQKIDYEIESLAKKYTIEFMSHKAFAGDLTYQQILQVYKIMIMPEEILQTYMFNLNAEALRPEFRRMAKIIHPDKNKHPNAGHAFQKIYKVYEAALSRLEGTQQKI